MSLTQTPDKVLQNDLQVDKEIISLFLGKMIPQKKKYTIKSNKRKWLL